MEQARLHESPVTCLTLQDPEGLFMAGELDELIQSLESVSAAAAT